MSLLSEYDRQATYMARIVPYNPFAFPPSMVVRCRRYESREGRGRAKQDARAESRVGNNGRDGGSAENAWSTTPGKEELRAQGCAR